MTLTYNPRLAKVKVDPHAKNQGQRSNVSNRRAPTDKLTHTHAHGQTDGHTRIHTDATKCIISPATRSIIKSGSEIQAGPETDAGSQTQARY